MLDRSWKLARRSLPYGERTLVMGVLNITPDSFSDGGQFFSLDFSIAHAKQMIAEGADIIDILSSVTSGLRKSVELAEARGVARASIAVDPGIGFGKTVAQNIELIAKLDQLAREFAGFPILVGTSRKSFIGKLLENAPADQ